MIKKDLVLAWTCICFLFLSLIFFGWFLAKTNSDYTIFEQKCERVNLNHLTIKMLVENREGFLLTNAYCYRVKDLCFEKWARMLDEGKVVLITDEAVKQLQKNLGLTEEKK